MPTYQASESFVQQLVRVLQHLYDPAALRGDPLITIFTLERHLNPLSALVTLLTDAVRALRPGANVPADAESWVVYHVLNGRYVEKTQQQQLAIDLGFSIRQLRRKEEEAVHVLADYLWSRYHLEAKRHLFDNLSTAPADSTISGGVSTSRELELAWLKQSFPCETADVASLIDAVLHRAAPLLRSAKVQVECSIPEHRPPITGQLAPMRQALLNLLTAAAHATTEGKIQVTVQTGEHGIDMSMQAGNGPAIPSTTGQISEALGMARELAELCGCALTVAPIGSDEQAFSAMLRLPLAVQKAVLVIDDNVDAQRLFERYVAGTCYRCVGIRAPEEAVAMAVQVEPCAILLDVMLPGIDGWELLERLREHPTLARVPVIVCTILPDEEMAFTLGAAGFLRKPVTRQALLSALDRALAIAPGSS